MTGNIGSEVSLLFDEIGWEKMERRESIAVTLECEVGEETTVAQELITKLHKKYPGSEFKRADDGKREKFMVVERVR